MSLLQPRSPRWPQDRHGLPTPQISAGALGPGSQGPFRSQIGKNNDTLLIFQGRILERGRKYWAYLCHQIVPFLFSFFFF